MSEIKRTVLFVNADGSECVNPRLRAMEYVLAREAVREVDLAIQACAHELAEVAMETYDRNCKSDEPCIKFNGLHAYVPSFSLKSMRIVAPSDSSKNPQPLPAFSVYMENDFSRKNGWIKV